MKQNDCILCGKCLEVCPLLRATGREELSPRTKADLFRLLSGDDTHLSSESSAQLAGLCLGCQRCVKACPQSVDVPAMVAALRGNHPDFKSWLWKTWLTKADKLWASSGKVARCIPEKFQPEKFSSLLKMLAGLREGQKVTPFLKMTSFPDTYRGKKMLLFAGCTANYVQKGWLVTARQLLDGLGVEVAPADFQCCGGGLRSAGFAEDAKDTATANVDTWRMAGKPMVVTFCESCQAALLEYDKGFNNTAEMLRWKASVIPLSGLLRKTTFVLSDEAPGKVGFHRPCHVDNADSDYMFLNSVLGPRLCCATHKECCGFGGVMRLGEPALSGIVNERCWTTLAGADVVLSGCSACVTQLAATAPKEVATGHWLEIVE